MTHITLPDDLPVPHSAEVQLYRYRVSSDVIRNRIVLTHNVISFLRHGEKEFVGGEYLRVTSDQFVAMKAGRCLMTEYAAAHNGRYESMLLFFSAHTATRLLADLDLTPAHQHDRSSHAFDYDPYLLGFAESLDTLSSLTVAERTRARMLEAKLRELVLYLTERDGPAAVYSALAPVREPLYRLIDVVESNRLVKLSLSDLAFLCHMSISTFKRAFRQHYQDTPIRWFQRQRLAHAALQLKSGRHRPIDVFEEAGYHTLSNFVHAFKKEYGTTPKRYQQTP